MTSRSLPMRDHVVAVLRQAIVELRFKPGEKLIERRLCEMTGASRTALREGLRQLEAEGLIDIIPNRGPMVPLITAKQARDIYDLRELLEARLARLAAQKATGLDLAELKSIGADISAAMHSRNRPAIIAAKRAYYDWFLRIAENDELSTILRRLLGRMSHIWPVLMARETADVTAGITDIAQIIAAVCRHDADQAAAASATHMRRSGLQVAEFLKTNS